ncbi:MAG: hypothetical protein HUJ25_13765 [Crocinitomicaceae bacterium]|nr:hypothetical protein [Crocinitomicaceae bacterium]
MKPLLIVLFLGLTLNLYGQYSNDPATFLKEINKRLVASDREKTKAFMEEFEPNWLTNFTSEYQNRVVATCNLLEEKRRPAFPDIYGYLLSVHTFVLTDQSKSSFETWHATIDALLNSKKSTDFQKFITVCAGFFTDGTIYEVPKYKWSVTGGDYVFKFENNRPKIIFTNADLACHIFDQGAGKKENPYLDSMIVRGTTGTFEPFVNRFSGRGGIMDWARTGLDPKKNYAEITDYKLSMKQTKLECDSVLVHTEYYPEPLYGDFKDFAKKYDRDIDRIYPKFTSFSKEVVRKNILPEVDYVGGFALEGDYFAGIGYDKNPAKLVFYMDGEPFVEAQATSFKINEKGASANDCGVKLYMSEDDTIYHPGLRMNYINAETPYMEMIRSNSGLAQAPFKDTYHLLDMYVDKIVWTKGDPNLNLTWNFENRNDRQARFESQNYYSGKVYSKIQGMNKVHPLVAIYNYSYKYDMQTIPIGKIAGPMGYTTDQAIPILLDLANQGFITYSSTRKEITVQPKTKKYIDARAGTVDYDNIVFVSNLEPIALKDTVTRDGRRDKNAEKYNARARKVNARKELATSFGSYNMKSFDLALNEVEPIEVSPSQKVILFPGEGELLVKKDLDFVFQGAIMAGKFEVYVNEANFEYKYFKIHLIDVRRALFSVAPIFGGNGLQPMYSHFEDFKGVIEIDHPANKSGRDNKHYPDYPKVKSTQDSYVFYDQIYIYDGVYDSSDFYFRVDPFEFDSLDNFDERAMAFPGEFRSAGIFPVFRETLRLQEDYSFGFVTKAPETGFDFYGDYAKFDNEIRLSNEGLRGAGQIDFETSTSVSENFIFFPDSTMGMAKYVNRPQTKSEGMSVPDVEGNGVMVTLVPKDDILKARAYQEPLKFFNGAAEMKGITYLTKNGMTGRGLMYFEEAELGSKHFEYSRWVIDADTADFNLLGVGKPEPGVENPLAFDSRNLNAHVDFEQRKGEFKSNDGTSVVEFPKNQYICYMDMFTWLMDNDEIELSKKEADIDIDTELDLAGSNFFSIHPEQDSLNFMAPKAKFILSENVINCDRVKYIDVADARIFPPEEKVTIRKKAKMDELKGAEILANSVTKYHTIREANVQINARMKYEANGKYVYVDSKGGEQEVYFADIQPDTAFQTRAKGTVEQETNFHLSDRFDFYGTVELVASEQFLVFDGATRINHDCERFAKNWLKFRTQIDPNNIQIPVSTEMTDLEGNPIAVGLVRRQANMLENIEIYPTFLSALDSVDDDVIFTSHGVLNYNEAANEFRIATPEKLINRAEKGNYIALHTVSCSMEGDGQLDMSLGMEDVEFKPYGVINYNAANKKTTMNLTGGLEFYLDKKITETIAEDIKTTEGLGAVDFGRTTLKQAITEEASKEEAENIETKYVTGEGVKKLPKTMESAPIYFTNLRFEWHARANGLISQPITGIVAMGGDPLFKDFTVRVMIRYFSTSKNSGTSLGILIELPGKEDRPGNRYYIELAGTKGATTVYVYSTNKELQTYLSEQKADKLKNKKTEIIYTNKTKRLGRFMDYIPQE